MAKFTGANMVLDVGGSEISAGYVRSIEWNDESELIETTGAANDDDTFMTSGIVGHQGSMEVLDDLTRATIHDILSIGTHTTSVLYPNGTAASQPKAEGTIVINSRSNPFQYKGLAIKAINFAWSGAVAWGTTT